VHVNTTEYDNLRNEKSKKRENGQKNEMKTFSVTPKETYLLFIQQVHSVFKIMLDSLFL
jgi:hypothetical protein